MSIHRRRAALSRAVHCELLERRMLLSLAPAGPEFRVNTFTTNAQSVPAVAADADGDFVVAWASDFQDGSANGIYAQRYNAGGAAQGGEFRVNAFTAGAQRSPALAMDADGDFVVAWHSNLQDGSTYGVFAQRYNAVGLAQGSEFRVNTHTTNQQLSPRVAMDAGGNFVVAWASLDQDGSGNGIYAQRYNAAGVAQGGEFRVNSFTTSDQSTPAVAMDASGDFVVEWRSFGQDGSDYGIYAQRFNAAGIAQGSEFRVNTFTTNQQRSQSVAMDADGDFVVVWLSYGQDGSNLGVYAQRYNAAGVAQGSEFRVNTFTTDRQSAASVTMDADGDIVVTWESNNQDGAAFGIYAQAYNAAGVAQGSEFRVNTITADTQRFPAVAMNANGDAVVVWQSNLQDGSGDGVYAQRYEVTALPAGAEFRVNTFTTNGQRGPDVASDADGDFAVVWASAGQEASDSFYGVYAQRYSSSGVPLGVEFRVNTTTSASQTAPSIAMEPDGDFVVAWSGNGAGDTSGVFLQRYDASGEPRGGELLVNTFTTSVQSFAAVAIDSDGDFLVVWQGNGQGDNFGIFARRFSAAGVPQGEQFILNTFTTLEQFSPQVAMDADGDFVVMWTDGTAAAPGQDGSASGIYAQRFNSAGVPQGGEFRVNTITAESQQNGSVAMDDSGDFIVTWTDYGPLGRPSSFDVKAQRYDAAGVAQGGEFLVNSFPSSPQKRPDVDMSPGGEFVITWQSQNQEGTLNQYGIYAQRYNAAGAKRGNEFRVNTFTTGSQKEPALALDTLGNFVISWESRDQDGSNYGIYAQRYRSQSPAPAVSAASFLFDATPHRLQFTFNDDVSGSLGTDDILLENLTTSTTIPSSDLSLSYDAATNTATFSYTGNASGISGVLPDGNYRATLLASGITNPSGTPLAANHIFNFFFLNGDANHDVRVNLSDFNILAANFGQSPRNFSQGDFNYDAIVNLSDFNILASRFGDILGPEGRVDRMPGTTTQLRSRDPWSKSGTLMERFQDILA